MIKKGIFPGRRSEFFRELASLRNHQDKIVAPAGHYLIFKTVGDYFLAALFFMISFPLWVMVTFWIKLDTSGPALFRQRRAGLKGKPFWIYKFRSMYREVDPEAMTAFNPHDHRITPIGRIIRRLGLDELPQLVNVLEGKMSLVGPRPEMLFIVSQYNELERKRLLVKPGLTGLWQIMGRKDRPIHEELALDLFYLQKQSLFWDFFILFETIPAVLLSRVIW